MMTSRLPDKPIRILGKLAEPRRTLRVLLLAIALPLLLACKPAEPPRSSAHEYDGMVPLRVSVLNYTDHYIGVVYVNDSWAANALAHSGGGGTAGSAEVPRQWDPNYKLTIHWRDEALYEKDKQGLFKREVAWPPCGSPSFLAMSSNSIGELHCEDGKDQPSRYQLSKRLTGMQQGPTLRIDKELGTARIEGMFATVNKSGKLVRDAVEWVVETVSGQEVPDALYADSFGMSLKYWPNHDEMPDLVSEFAYPVTRK